MGCFKVARHKDLECSLHEEMMKVQGDEHVLDPEVTMMHSL